MISLPAGIPMGSIFSQIFRAPQDPESGLDLQATDTTVKECAQHGTPTDLSWTLSSVPFYLLSLYSEDCQPLYPLQYSLVVTYLKNGGGVEGELLPIWRSTLYK